MRKIIALFGALVLLCLAVPLAVAQANPPSSPSLLADIWSVLSPLVTLAVSIVGPMLIGWLSMKLAAVLNIQGAAKQQEFESSLRDALHQSMVNGAKVASMRLGMPTAGSLTATSPVVKAAVDYVQKHNPDAVATFGLDVDDLAEIALSKLHDLIKVR